jgi:bifunctional non-homologous end joining protein LigD
MPTIRETLPTGPRWLFEVKADGWRVQLVKDGKSLRIVSRTGKDLTAMLGPFPSSLRIPAQTAVLDGEPVTGLADFGSLRSAIAREPMSLLVFAFDLLHLDGRDFRPQPLVVRRARLGRMIARADTPALQISQAFKDGA